MLRLTCPWCGTYVNTTSSQIIKTENGRGKFKTTMYAHRSCYERVTGYESKNNEHGQTDKAYE